MYRGYDDNDGNGSGYNRGKRGYEDDRHDRDGGASSYYGRDDDRGGYKRSRHERNGGGGSYYRPQQSGGDRGRMGGGGAYDRNSYSESESARGWRLTKKAIVELGEGVALEALTGDALRDQLVEAATLVSKQLESDQDVKLNHVASKLVHCAGRLAHKSALYAVLVGLVHEKEPAFGRKVLEYTLATLQKDVDFFHADREEEQMPPADVDEDAFRKANDVESVALRVRLMVRFLGELVSTRVVRAYDVLGVLDALQSVCTPDDFNVEADEALRTRETLAAFKDFFASVVLDTLIHAGQHMAVGCDDVYQSLVSRCKEYVLSREEESNPRGNESEHSTNWLTRRLRLDLIWEPESDEDMQSACKKCDLLSLEWEALNGIRSDTSALDDADAAPRNIAKLPGILRPQDLLDEHFQAPSEPLPITTSISIEASNLNHAKVPRYQVVFRILGEDSGSVGAPLMNLNLGSYLITRHHISDALTAFNPKPAIAAKHVLAIAKAYNARFNDDGVANLQTQYILLEALLVSALNERDSAKHCYYCAVLTHLIKADARFISSAFAIVVELMFREVPLMSAGAVDAFVKLFSHFLSNFEFKWMWERWSDVLEAQEDDPQRLFVSTVIERCVRLSYLQHIRSVLPSDFHVLLPPEPKPRIVYLTEDTDEGDVSPTSKAFFDAVSTKLKEHPSSVALQMWIEQEIESKNIDKETAIDIVFTAILNSGSATFTHARIVLDKFGSLNGLFSGEAAELLLVKTVGFVWVKSPLHIGLILNMMLRQRTIHAATVAKWIFTSDAIQQYSWPYVWGILDDTLSFVQNGLSAKINERGRGTTGSAEQMETAMTDVDSLEDEIKRLQDELRQLVVIVFEGFNRVIMEHKSNCDADGISHKDNWFASALAQMKALGGKYRGLMDEVLDELHLSVFKSSAADHDAKKVFDFVWDSYRSAVLP